MLTVALLVAVGWQALQISGWSNKSGEGPVEAVLETERHPTGDHGQTDPALLSRLDTAEQGIEVLQRALRAEQSSTLALQNELQELREQFAAAAFNGESGAQQGQTSPPIDGAAEPLSDAVPGSGQNRRPRARLSDEAALISAGVDEETARQLQARIDRYTLAELEVRDTAAREGWLDSSDYRERRDALLPSRVNIREELGEQAWENYLLATGRNNRVRVDSVIRDSAAHSAGIEVGDLLLEYAGEAIFSIRELQQATRAGERGEPVSVRLGRGTNIVDTSVVRGPLGVTLSGIQQGLVE